MKPFQWLAVVPFIGLLIGPVLHNHLHPFIFGMPFPLGWITIWILLTSVIMAIVYVIDPANKGDVR